MNTVFLHVGTHKTGTTTIQRFFEKHRDPISDHGILYLKGPEPNHSLLMLSLFEKDAWYLHGEHFRTSTAKRQYFDGENVQKNFLRFSLSADQAAKENKNAFISGEAIYHLSEEGMQRLRSFLLERFDKIIVIAFARPPLEFAHSYAQEALKFRRTLTDFLMSPPLPNYKIRLGKFITIFGKDSMVVRAFSRESFPGGSSLRQILPMVGAQSAESIIEENSTDDQNVSISMLAAKLISVINETMKDLSQDDFERYYLACLRNLEGAKFLLSREIADKVVELSKKDVDWMRNEFGINFLSVQAELTGLPTQESLTFFSSADIARTVKFFCNDKRDVATS